MPLRWRESGGVFLIAVGVVVLAINLALRHVDSDLVIGATSWLGAILVIVGLGSMLFLER